MKNRQKREVACEVLEGTAERGTVLVTEVYYSLGGMNYFTYKNQPRGYYVSVGRVKRDVTGTGLRSESFGMFSHYAAFLEPAKMFSAKRLAAIAPAADVVAPLRERALAHDGATDRKAVEVP